LLPSSTTADRERRSVSVVTNGTQLEEEGMRMWRNAAWIAALTALAGSLFVGIVEGGMTLTPFDFTGHWIGCAVGQVPLEGDFTAVGLRKLKGSLTVQDTKPEQCTVKGKRKTEQLVVARFNCKRPCDQGSGVKKSTVRVQGQLDVGSETITGPYTITERGCGKPKTNSGQLVITKETSPPSLCSTPTTTSSSTSTSTSLP
jgi:hypothetical protein